MISRTAYQALAWITAIAMVIHFGVIFMLLRRLKRFHSEEWKIVGSPNGPVPRTRKSWRAFSTLTKESKCRVQTDDMARFLCKFYRFSNPTTWILAIGYMLAVFLH
jgi:hypothetical protein